MYSNTIIHKLIRHSKWLFKSINGYFKFNKVLDESTYVFLSHNADSAGGAPVVLFELMKSLKNEKKVVFLCERPGKIMDLCDDQEIPVFCTYLIQKYYLKHIVKKNVKAVMVNTIILSNAIKFFNKQDSKIPIFWWIHEEGNIIFKYKDNLPSIGTKNVHILCVSSKVQRELLKYCPEYSNLTMIFHYGCNDSLLTNIAKAKDKKYFIISCIGRICERKNQQQIIDAYNLLPVKYKKNIFINFVSASADEHYKKKMLESIDGNDNIKFKGPIKRENIVDVYMESDLIICSSIDDPLPVVITEAMMFKRPFITSSGTGHYDIIKYGINGYTYNVDSTRELCEAIVDIYDSNDLTKVIENARKTYCENFTTEIAKKYFIKLLNEV